MPARNPDALYHFFCTATVSKDLATIAKVRKRFLAFLDGFICIFLYYVSKNTDLNKNNGISKGFYLQLFILFSVLVFASI